MKNKISVKQILLIQMAVVLYTFSGIAGKAAAGYEMLSLPFLFFIGLELFVLGCYAIVWQQVIKRFPLSLAYVNRAMAIFWSMIWAFLFFQERITWKNILGVIVIFAGTMVVNSDEF